MKITTQARILKFFGFALLFYSCGNVTTEQYLKPEKDYNLEAVIEYLKPTDANIYLINQEKDSLNNRFIGISLGECKNVGKNGIDPTVALSYTALMIFAQGLGNTDGIRVELIYDYDFKRTGPITNEHVGNAKYTYPREVLEWAKAAHQSFENWYDGTGENDFNTCVVQDPTVITDYVELFKSIKSNFTKIMLIGFTEVRTKQQGFEKKLLLFYKASDAQNKMVELFATVRPDNKIESLFISNQQDKGFEPAVKALKNNCFLY